MKLAVIAEFDSIFEPHVQTDAAISHSADALDLEVDYLWLSTSDLKVSNLSEFDALWFAPGSPYRDLDRTLEAIRFARENSIPCLGTCGGFQHMVIEVARNVAKITDAQHAEYDPYASRLIVSQLECSLVGREMSITLIPDSVAEKAYRTDEAIERYYCNFGVNPEFVGALSDAGFSVVGTDADGVCRVMEIAEHPFFIGTLFVPQARSTPLTPHPLVNAFLLAGANQNARAGR